MINELAIQNVLNSYADKYIRLFDEFVQRETIKNRQDVIRAYDDWVIGYAQRAYEDWVAEYPQSNYYNNLYLSPEINIEYDEDEEEYVVFGYMNIDYNNNTYEIELYDSYGGIYEEYPWKINEFVYNLK